MENTSEKKTSYVMPSYVVVTPAFNEEKNIRITIDSMISQELKPRVWVIVDDGSTDRTWEIIHEVGKSYSWIRSHRCARDPNVGRDGLIDASEAKAFLVGLQSAFDICPKPDFVVKLDADLEFDPNYFNEIFREFLSDPKLGICGGVIYEYKGPRLVRERVSSTHVRGATKIYRYECYRDIGGIRQMFGWDVIDEILACAHGWEVKSFDHLHLTHLRRTASRGGRFAGWARNGYMAYYIGISPLRMLVRAAFRFFFMGDVIQAGGLVFGYFGNFLKRAQKLPDPELRRLVRQYQWVTAHKALDGPRSTT